MLLLPSYLCFLYEQPSSSTQFEVRIFSYFSDLEGSNYQIDIYEVSRPIIHLDFSVLKACRHSLFIVSSRCFWYATLCYAPAILIILTPCTDVSGR